MENEQRSLSQNNSLHKWLTEIATLLNEQGKTMKEVMSAMREYEVKPTMHGLKENVWKPIQEAMFGTTSTTELKKSEKQIDDIIDVMTKIFAQIEVTLPPFPSEESRNFIEYYSKQTYAKNI